VGNVDPEEPEFMTEQPTIAMTLAAPSADLR
jgi:hypothetical protein